MTDCFENGFRRGLLWNGCECNLETRGNSINFETGASAAVSYASNMKRIALVFALGAALACPTFAQPAGSTNAASASPPPGAGDGGAAAVSLDPITKGLRVFTVGHSFHVWVARIVLEMAQSAGIQDHQVAGLMGVGGSTVLQCWDVPDMKSKKKQPPENTAKKALMAGQVDVLTLSPIWMPDEGIEKFAALGLQYNPNIRVTVQEFWLPNDTYEPVYPLNIKKQPTVDHNAATMPELRKHYEAYFHDVDNYVQAVNQKLGKDAVLIVPIGQATLALREKIVAGQAPGIATQAELFRDPWGHPTAPLQVLSGYCHFAVIYRRSPVGLPMPPELKGKYRNDALNGLLQELAWEAVVHHPMSGVKVGAPIKSI